MIGRFSQMAFDAKGNPLVTFSLPREVIQAVTEWGENELDITIKRHRKKRSLDANALCWVLIDRLAEKLNESPADVYREIVRDIPGVSDWVCVREEGVEALRNGWLKNGIGWQSETAESKVPGCVNVRLIYGSSTYDTAQMSALIDRVKRECEAQGVSTADFAELERLEANR